MKRYNRLPGHGENDFSRYSLWLGEDHLLSVTRQGSREYYRRIRLNNIQAIIIEPTRRWIVVHVLSALLTLPLAYRLNHLYHQTDYHQSFEFWLECAVFLPLAIGWLVAAIRGPTCACWIKTAVQTDRIYAMGHLRPALQSIKRITAAVESVQGALSSGDIAEKVNEHHKNAISTSSGDMPGTIPYSPPTPFDKATHRELLKTHISGRFHLALFALMLIDFVDSCISVLWPDYDTPTLIASSVLFGFFITAIPALIRQNGSTLPRKLKVLTWLSACYVIVFLSAAVVLAVIPNFLSVLEYGYVEGGLDGLAEFIFSALSAIIAGPIGMLGLKWTHQFRRTSVKPPPLPPPP